MRENKGTKSRKLCNPPQKKRQSILLRRRRRRSIPQYYIIRSQHRPPPPPFPNAQSTNHETPTCTLAAHLPHPRPTQATTEPTTTQPLILKVQEANRTRQTVTSGPFVMQVRITFHKTIIASFDVDIFWIGFFPKTKR